jgi:hypothetical protein
MLKDFIKKHERLTGIVKEDREFAQQVIEDRVNRLRQEWQKTSELIQDLERQYFILSHANKH